MPSLSSEIFSPTATVFLLTAASDAEEASVIRQSSWRCQIKSMGCSHTVMTIEASGPVVPEALSARAISAHQFPKLGNTNVSIVYKLFQGTQVYRLEVLRYERKAHLQLLLPGAHK